MSDYHHFSHLRSECRRIGRGDYQNYVENVESSLHNDPSSFWRYVKSMKGERGYPSTMHLGGNYSSDPSEICNIFAKHFSSIYSRNSVSNVDPSMSDIIYDGPSFDLGSLKFSVDEILRKLKVIKTNKGMGPDGVPPLFLRNCAEALTYPLFILFNKSVSTGEFPLKFKTGCVVPVFKSGDRSDVSKYRAIVKLPAISKLFEKLILDKLLPALPNIIIPEQHGFMSNRSTVSNLFILQDYILGRFKENVQVDVIYTDFAKAFDLCQFDILINKCKKVGICNGFLKWLSSYLTGRSQCVKLRPFYSNMFSVLAGVPQGSHLGPILFLIFINDIGLNILHSHYLLFADDLKLFRAVYSSSDCIKLQSDLYKIVHWCIQNDMSLNVDKCKVMSFSRRRRLVDFTYRISDSNINRVTLTTDLGVTFDSRLTFCPHIDHVVGKAFRLLGCMYRYCRSFNNLQSFRTLYCSNVRSTLEYASIIWSPQYAVHINRIEGIQRRFLDMVSYKFLKNEVSREDVASLVGLIPLESRRRSFDVLFLFKILNNLIDCPELLQKIPFNITQRITRYSFNFRIPLAANNFGVSVNYVGCFMIVHLTSKFIFDYMLKAMV